MSGRGWHALGCALGAALFHAAPAAQDVPDLVGVQCTIVEGGRLVLRPSVADDTWWKGLETSDDAARGLVDRSLSEVLAGNVKVDAVAALAVLIGGGPSAGSATRTSVRIGLPVDVQSMRDLLAGRPGSRKPGSSLDPVLRQVLALRVVAEHGMRGTVDVIHGPAWKDAHPVVGRILEAVRDHHLYPDEPLLDDRKPAACRLGLPADAQPVLWIRPDHEVMTRPIAEARRQVFFETGNQDFQMGGRSYGPGTLWEIQCHHDLMDLLAWRLARLAGPWHVDEVLAAKKDGKWLVRVVGTFDWVRLADAFADAGAEVDASHAGAVRAVTAAWDLCLASDPAALAKLEPSDRPCTLPGVAEDIGPRLWLRGGFAAMGDLGTFEHAWLQWETGGAIRAALTFPEAAAAAVFREAFSKWGERERQRVRAEVGDGIYENEGAQAIESLVASTRVVVDGAGADLHFAPGAVLLTLRGLGRLRDWRMR